ncbi:histidine biosynthesis bifunctional protein hisIE, chloroplastic-like isoform X2 [Prosopis cineraria]|uniref:histidine biosynthesis bifunctional protein hisIE, chloroplastic-like isoform X2 n=1 Tax=Prosopis cineraria TaxID=364024 RepID=UPI00240F37F7|nr:histidine biosynthesis bifunctional protein hisIE, chloroplastic-like isoform X2 [Prosopis cineraria]
MAVSYAHMLQSATFLRKNCRLLSCYDCRKYNGERGRTHVVFASIQQSERDVSIGPKVESLLDSVKWDRKGLAGAIAQNVDPGAILMQGFASRDAAATTISSRKATFYDYIPWEA